MKPIKIELESGASLAIIIVQDMDATLNAIRKQIQDEVSELVPEDFHFISSWGPPISRVQEAKITLNEALRDEKLVIRKKVDEMSSLKRKAVDIDEDTTKVQKAASRGKRTVQSTLTKVFGAKSSPTARYASATVRKGVHIFSEQDIASSSDKEKERKTWWNEKATNLCEDPAYGMLKEDELDQALHEQWRLYKAAKMLQEQKETKEAIEDFLEKHPNMEEHMASKSKAKQATIERNVKRLEMAKSIVESSGDTLKHLSLQMQNAKKEGKEFESLKKKIQEQKEAHQCHCRELAKALDALRNNLAIRKQQLHELLKKKDTESENVSE